MLKDDDPLLMTSPFVRAIAKTLEYIDANDGIGLTKSGAFNRKFVEWAAVEFNWPDCTPEHLYRLNKVLDEWDVPPVSDIHDFLLAMKFGRHYKGKFKITKDGRKIIEHPSMVFNELVPNYLFRFDHGSNLRREEPLFGNWDIWLNVVNVEADAGTSQGHIREVLYGKPEDEGRFYDEIGSSLYIQVLRPLCWAGLLQTPEDSDKRFGNDKIFFKTDLWRKALSLDTDVELKAQPLQ